MPSVRVDAAEVTALGVRLLDLADDLAGQGDGRVDAWAFGQGRTVGAFEELVGHWQLERGRLCGALADLGDAAAAAGGLYVDVEALIGRSMTGGDR